MEDANGAFDAVVWASRVKWSEHHQFRRLWKLSMNVNVKATGLKGSYACKPHSGTLPQ